MPDQRDLRDIVIETNTIMKRLDEELLTGKNARVPAVEKTVDKHSEQINFWRGAIALCGFLLLTFGAVLLAHVLSAKP